MSLMCFNQDLKLSVSDQFGIFVAGREELNNAENVLI